jgi:hypothetical protein
MEETLSYPRRFLGSYPNQNPTGVFGYEGGHLRVSKKDKILS